MIDPIGLIGTLIAIIQVCNKVVSVCYDYRNGVRGAPREISLVLNEIASVGEIARRLFQIADTNASSESPMLQTMATGGGTLEKCLDELVDLKASLKLGKKIGRTTVLVWPWKQPEAEKRLQIIGRIKLTLQLALSADNAQNMAELLARTGSLTVIQKDVARLTTRIETSDKDRKRAEILGWLRGRDQTDKHQQEFQKCVKGTGAWLLKSDDYMSWKNNSSQLLWVNGIAGCGKSVLCAKVIEDLRSHCDGDEDVGLGYFYIDGSDQRPLDMECLYRSFIAQLVPQDTSLPYDLTHLHSIYGPNGYSSIKSLPMPDLEALLKEVLQKRTQSYLVLDALDECEEFSQLGLDRIAEFITKLTAMKTRAQLIAFSRNLEQLRNIFDDLNATNITIESDTLNADLQIALRYQLSSQRKFAKWPPLLKKSIEAKLLAQANGSFRWLDCQLQSLQRCATPVAVRKVLDDLPKTLEAHYTRVLEKVDESNRDSVKNMLRWVAFGLRPLSLTEITRAVAINTANTDGPFFDEHLELLDPESFVDSLSTLLTTYRDYQDHSGYPEVYVKLAHFTVREFLGSDAIRSSSSSDFYMESDLSHAYLSWSCLAYFHYAIESQADDPEVLEEITILDPFISYAGHFWIKHKRLTDRDDSLDASFQSHLVDIFDTEKPFYKVWLQLANLDRPWLKEGSEPSQDCTPLYCAAYIGFPHVARILLERGADPNEEGGLYGNALQAACFNGHLGVVRDLLRYQANIDAVAGACGTAISAAAAANWIDIVAELIEAGASVTNPNPWDTYGERRDPLYLAVVGGHLPIVELLLKNGAKDFYHMKGKPPSALQASVKTGRLDIVKALLGYERIQTANRHGCSALIRPVTSGFAASQYDAAYRGHIDILRELMAYGIKTDEAFRYAARAGDEALVLEHLEKGTDLDGSGCVSDHPRALQSAALGGHLSLVKTLLAHGADPNLKSDYSTALVAAVEGGSIEVVQALIDAGARLDTDWPDPLVTAINAGNSDIVELLIQNGADSRRAFQRSTLRGDFKSFRLLLRLGVDPRHTNQDGELSMLATACWGGSIPIVQYLLDNGFQDQLNPEEGTTTPLMAALCAKRWSVVPLLLGRGADVNATPPLKSEAPSRGGSYYNGALWPLQPPHESPLTIAVKEKSEDVAHLLIQHGAQVTPETPVTAGTPLLYAISEELTDLARDLLQAGANPKQRGMIQKRGKPSFPLLVAAEKGNVEIIKHLVDAGALVDDQDEEGFSALHAAATGRENTKALEALIQDHGADFKVQLQNGSQPIHSAAAKGTAHHVKVLLDAGADIDQKNDSGRTPLHWAADSGNWDTLEMLLDNGADSNVKSDEGGASTPLDLAFLARDKSSWQWIANSNEWNSERVGALLEKL